MLPKVRQLFAMKLGASLSKVARRSTDDGANGDDAEQNGRVKTLGFVFITARVVEKKCNEGMIDNGQQKAGVKNGRAVGGELPQTTSPVCKKKL